jgi:hypothetical protein
LATPPIFLFFISAEHYIRCLDVVEINLALLNLIILNKFVIDLLKVKLVEGVLAVAVVSAHDTYWLEVTKVAIACSVKLADASEFVLSEVSGLS